MLHFKTPRMQELSRARRLRMQALLVGGTLAMSLLAGEEKKPKVPRTRDLHRRWGTYYNRLSDAEFRACFRLPRVLFDRVLNTIRADIEFSGPCVRTPISAEDKLALYVKRLAEGTVYNTLAGDFSASVGYCSRIAADVSAAILLHFGDEIRWPSRAEAMFSRDIYRSRYGVEHCIAAMDGSHARIRAEAETRLADFNHKGWYSFNLHVVCDNDFIIYDAHIGNAGANGDSTLWKETLLYRTIMAPSVDGWHGFLPPSGFIVGDGGYHSNPFTITPYQVPQLTSPELRNFNFMQSRIRRSVEQLFGILKRQWQLIDKSTEHSKGQKVVDVRVCCIFHNMMQRYKLSLAPNAAYRVKLEAEYEALLQLVDADIDAREDVTDAPGLPDAVTAAMGEERRRVVVLQLWEVRNRRAAAAAAQGQAQV